ncbi:MAG: SAP domain-containing protein [Clostridiales bacterium]|nr:SAP domain-containing protein [Clostridiales bacterium]
MNLLERMLKIFRPDGEQSSDEPSNAKNAANPLVPPSECPIPEEEQQYYRPEEYYTENVFSKSVITFEERKAMSYPSEHGLYVAEILLLHYCHAYGTYPHPKNGYPGFWWFDYGIRNVGAVLESLAERGFLCYVPAKKGLARLTVAQLKEVLAHFGLSTVGKKADLVQVLQDNVSEVDLAQVMPSRKYMLTELGEQELKGNEYVAYMHNHKDIEFSVYRMNSLVHQNPSVSYRDILWGEYNRLLLVHLRSEEFGLYRNTRLTMARFLSEENQPERELDFISQTIYLDLNIYPISRQSPKGALAPGLFKRTTFLAQALGYNEKQLADKILPHLSEVYAPYKNYTPSETVAIIVAYSFGHETQADVIFRKKM